MKNWKRILAAVGTAALLVSNVGAVSQVVFAEEGVTVEDTAGNEGDVSEDDVAPQTEAVIVDTPDVLEDPTDETKQDQPDTSNPSEGTGTAGETTPVPAPTEEPSVPAAPTETPEPAGGDDATSGDETVPGENEGTVTDEETVMDGKTIARQEDPTDEVDDEEDEETLVSPEYGQSVAVQGDDRITVKASADKNVLPEGAVLVARLIEQDTTEYQEVEQALIDSNDVDYAGGTQTAENADDSNSDDAEAADGETAGGEGFIAMDIHFEVRQPAQSEDAEQEADAMDAETEDADTVTEDTDTETEDAENDDPQGLEDADDASDDVEDVNGESDEADIEYEYVEVEPQGFVNITFDLEENVLPVEADPETLTVQHLVEDEDGNVDKIETVANTDNSEDSEIDGRVDVAEATDAETAPAMTVDFQTNTFSTFTITWKDSGTDEHIRFFYVDENMENIAPEEWEDWEIKVSKMKDQVDLQYFIRDIDGYVFDKVMVRDGEKDQSPRSFRYIVWDRAVDGITVKDFFWPEWIKKWILDGDDEDKAEFDWNNDNKFNNDAYVYLVYKQYAYTETTKADPTPDVTGSKTVTDNNDGTYDLTLNVTSQSGDTSKKPKVDMLFVLDTSSSMYKGWADGTVKSDVVKDTRADAARKAILETMEELNKNADAHFGLVTFSTYANHDTLRNTKYGEGALVDGALHVDLDYNNSNYSKLKTLLNSNAFTGRVELTDSGRPRVKEDWGFNAYVGDTNYDAAMLKTGQALDYARTDAKKIVIFLTDGIPTVAYNDNGTIWGNGHEYGAKNDPQLRSDLLRMSLRAVNDMDGIDLSGAMGDAFYVIGIGVDDSKGGDFDTYIRPLASKEAGSYTVNDHNGGLLGKKDNYVTVDFPGNGLAEGVTSEAIPINTGTKDLIKAFKDIIAEAVSYKAENVVISDPLSYNVELVKNANGAYELTILVTDDAGSKIVDNQTVTYKEGAADNKKVSYTVGTGTDARTITLTPSVETDGDGRQTIKLTFPADYELGTDWTYKVTTRIQPTDTALDYYRTNHLWDTETTETDGAGNTTRKYQYPDLADMDTGTYQAQQGLYTNGQTVNGKDLNAEITYSYAGNSGKVEGTSPRYTVTKAYSYDDAGDLQIVVNMNDGDGSLGEPLYVKDENTGKNKLSGKVIDALGRTTVDVLVRYVDGAGNEQFARESYNLQELVDAGGATVSKGDNNGLVVVIRNAAGQAITDENRVTTVDVNVDESESYLLSKKEGSVDENGTLCVSVMITGLGADPTTAQVKEALSNMRLIATVAKDENGEQVATKTYGELWRLIGQGQVKGYTDQKTGEQFIQFMISETLQELDPKTEYVVDVDAVIDDTADYNKPVIQLHPGKLVITKKITGLKKDTDIASAAQNTAFTVDVTKADGATIYKGLNIALPSDAPTTTLSTDTTYTGMTDYGYIGYANGTYTITICGLDNNAGYSVTEQKVDSNTSKPGQITNWEVKNYTGTDTSKENTSVQSTDGRNNTLDTRIKWNTTSNASFTNKYTNKIVDTGVVTDSSLFPAMVATIDVMAAMFALYYVARRRVH